MYTYIYSNTHTHIYIAIFAKIALRYFEKVSFQALFMTS